MKNVPTCFAVRCAMDVYLLFELVLHCCFICSYCPCHRLPRWWQTRAVWLVQRIALSAAAHSSEHPPALPSNPVPMQSARQAARVVLRAAATNGAVATRGAAAAKQIAAAYSTLARARCNGQQALGRREEEAATAALEEEEGARCDGL